MTEQVPPATLISASPEDSWGLQYLAPYAGLAVANHYRQQGQHVVLVLDASEAFVTAACDLPREFVGRPLRGAAAVCVLGLRFTYVICLFLIRNIEKQRPRTEPAGLLGQFLDHAGTLTEAAGGGTLSILAVVDTENEELAPPGVSPQRLLDESPWSQFASESQRL
eukprot:COSAG01_NODE_7146_length_3331_cov_7.400062_3_plen_166_part_00